MKMSSVVNPHDSALTHVSGSSEYVDDRPLLQNELHVGLVYSPIAKGKIKSIDTSIAKARPGVVLVLTGKDIGDKRWGTIFQDQPIVAIDAVSFVGEVVALVATTSHRDLYECVQAVKVEYEQAPAILSIDAAIAAKEFIGFERSIRRGDALGAIKNSPHSFKGELVIAGAEHFYMENQAAVAYPREGGQIEVHSSTQHPTETQHVVAKACGLRQNQVVCVTKRLGGGFGGKESQAAPIAAYAALVAQRTGRPARVVLTKDDDMIITGKRNPFKIFYEVGFDRDGKILGLNAQLYSDGGAYADLSTAIMERALLHSDNAYFIPNFAVTGIVCRTNVHPHTAFRGFGGPKGVALIEGAIEKIAQTLGIDALEVREQNCYRPGFDVTPYLQTVENNMLPQLFSTLKEEALYEKRRAEIAAANRASIGAPGRKLRGLSLTAVKFGISFTTRFLNQGNALVNVHGDGTVQVSTGAVEMGQGVNTRIAQLVAEQFGIPLQDVIVMPTSTEKNANTSPTAASSGTDINGSAAVLACQRVCKRLAGLAQFLRETPKDVWASRTAGLGTQAEYVDKPHNVAAQFSRGMVQVEEFVIPFKDLVREAYLNRISLSEYSHYATPNLGFNKVTGQGKAFQYFTQGTCASEVEVDCATGEVKVVRVDLLMDLGRPINEGLDLGQVTGAFVQGMGWVTTENLFYDKGGKLLSHSPSTYKIPNIQDTPRTFRVRLIENLGNTTNVRGTKAVGEPPLLLSLSVWTAIQDALKNVGADIGKLAIPATPEAILRVMDPDAFRSLEVH